MSEQPKALRLAEYMDAPLNNPADVADAAAELRRLWAVNQELLEALKDAVNAIEHWGSYSSDYFQQKWDLHSDINAARAAIARAEGQA